MAVVRIALRCQLAVTLWDHCSFRVFIDEFSDISLFLQILKLHSGLEEAYCYGGGGTARSSNQVPNNATHKQK